MILDKTCAGAVESYTLGYVWGLCSPCEWLGTNGEESIQRQENIPSQTDVSPLRSEIWFEDAFSMVAFE